MNTAEQARLLRSAASALEHGRQATARTKLAQALGGRGRVGGHSMLKRMWVNQPSELQVLHELHGANVLAEPEGEDYRIYFLSGDVVSQQAARECLSDGWK